MKCDISFFESDGFIHCELEGRSESNAARSVAIELKGAVEKYGTTHILMKLHGLKVHMSILDIYKQPGEFNVIGFPRHARIAAVIPGELWKDFEFIETVFVNDGYLFKVFDNEGAAREWLKQ